MVQTGPARTLDKSTTFRPSRAPAIYASTSSLPPLSYPRNTNPPHTRTDQHVLGSHSRRTEFRFGALRNLWMQRSNDGTSQCFLPVSYTHLRAHETDSYLVCRLLLEKKKKQ